MRASDTVSANCSGLFRKPGASTRMMDGMKMVASTSSTICAAICQAKICIGEFARPPHPRPAPASAA